MFVRLLAGQVVKCCRCRFRGCSAVLVVYVVLCGRTRLAVSSAMVLDPWVRDRFVLRSLPLRVGIVDYVVWSDIIVVVAVCHSQVLQLCGGREDEGGLRKCCDRSVCTSFVARAGKQLELEDAGLLATWKAHGRDLIG